MNKCKKILTTFITAVILISAFTFAIPTASALEQDEPIRTVGWQRTASVDGVYDLRIAAVLDTVDGISSAGFVIDINKENGDKTSYDENELACTEAYIGLNSDGKVISAQSFGGEYFVAVVFQNIPVTDGELTLEITPWIFINGEYKWGTVKTAVVKPSNDGDDNIEEVLFYDDFSSGDLSNYYIAEQAAGTNFSIQNGKLVMNAAEADGNVNLRLYLPEEVSLTSNVQVTVKVAINQSKTNVRWFGIVFNAQKDLPFTQFAVRRNPTAANGVELAHMKADGKYVSPTPVTASYSSNFTLNQEYELVLHLFNNHVVGTINGTVVLDAPNPEGLPASGLLGLQVNGLKASIDSIKVVKTTAPFGS